jgi:hypothetical protein
MTFLRLKKGRKRGVQLKTHYGQIVGQNDFPGKLALADLPH